MKALRYILLLILLFVCNELIVFGQRELTTNEIINYYRQNRVSKEIYNDSSMLSAFRFNKGLNAYINKIVDSLSQNLIDTTLIYSISPKGFFVMNRQNLCFDLYSPIAIYLFWKFNGVVNIKKIINGCEKGNMTIETNEVFDYYYNNREYIDDEILMPVIYGKVIEEDSVIHITNFGGLYDGQNIYNILYYDTTSWNMLTFGDDVFTIEENRFYEHNINLKIYNWFKIIGKQINDIKAK